jgi:outer membrane protein assembly factor BamB
MMLFAASLSGCSESLPSMPKISDLNPFAEKAKPLPGKRIAVMQPADKVGGAELASADRPVVLPPARATESWTQPGGVPNNAPVHLALASTVRPVWNVDAGTGSSSYGRLTASPVVYDGRVYTLDAAAHVSAFATSGGTAVWRVSLTPQGERDAEGYGGGLAADNGRLYAATGFGNVAALDPTTGRKLWEKNIGVPVRASPTAAEEKVFIVTTEGSVFALSGADGNELWNFRGLPEKTSIISNPSPAIDSGILVVPYPSGELVALRVADGANIWTESLSRTRSASSLASLGDAARPVIDNGTVFAVGHAGRMIATQSRTGERLWSLSIPGTQAPWVAGETVFVVDTSGQLLAITRRDGKVEWTVKLPGATTWSGPTLAGGILWLVSNKGQLLGVEATTGRIASQQDLGAPVYVAPIVAGNRMYVLTDKARLIALN